MRKGIVIVFLLLSCVIAFGQNKLTSPTQEWCEWAFRQIPDHKALSKVDSTAFSLDFYTLLSMAFTIDKWELGKDPGEMGYGEFLAYWYAGNGDSPLDEPNYSIQYLVEEVQNGESSVLITIHTPEWRSFEYHRFTMKVVFENGAWRIDDWINRNISNPISMRQELKNYINWFVKQQL